MCSAVSYFSTRVGSIIGAGRLSFRVRDGTGRFPAAMDRRNFIHSFLSVNLCVLVVGCGALQTQGVWVFMNCGCETCCVFLLKPTQLVFVGCCKFSAG